MVDTRADVVVVGGGIAGVSVAACLAPHVSVLLIEAEPQLAHHSTGRSAAAFLESYGSAEVQALTRASRPLLEAIAEHDDLAGPILSPRPLLWIAAFDQTAALDSLPSPARRSSARLRTSTCSLSTSTMCAPLARMARRSTPSNEPLPAGTPLEAGR
jgi:glycine/D-amino acid oxidase-like deaminating enzyme